MKANSFVRASEAAVFVLLFSGLLSGCSHHDNSNNVASSNQPAMAPSVAPIQAPQTMPKHVMVYVLASKVTNPASAPDDNGLVAIPMKGSAAAKLSATSAIRALITGTESPLPRGTRLLGLTVDRSTKIATVNFSKQFQTNFSGGETREAQAVNSVLQTLGQFPEIHQVQFLVAGQKIDSLGGNVELDEPLPTPQNGEQIASTNPG